MVQRGRQPALPESQHHLDQRGQGGRVEQVPDVRLHRTEQPRTPVLKGRESLRQGPQFDRVADGRTRPVGLDIRHRPGIDAADLVRPADHLVLSQRIGCHQAQGGAVVVDGGAAYDGQDLVVDAARFLKWPQDEGSSALTGYEPVGRGAEGAAAAGR